MTTKSSLMLGLCCLTLCAAADLGAERKSRDYQAAMADYTAGRLDAALAGFEKAVKADGDNASARFQLACLQQDFRHDFIGAVCNYREYLRLEGGSDKASLAKERMSLCERELAKELAAKYELGGSLETLKEGERVRAELAAAERDRDKATRALADAEKRVAVLERENARLRRQIRTVGADDERRNALADARALLEEEDSAAPRRVASNLDEEADGSRPSLGGLAEANDEDSAARPRKVVVDEEARAIADGSDAPRKMAKPAVEPDDGARGLRQGLAAAKALVEEDESGPDLLPEERTPAEKKLTDLASAPRNEAPREGEAYRPKTYVVQDGDSLYRIARRFYGRESAWKKIRDANKATITTDGRVNAGQTIILP